MQIIKKLLRDELIGRTIEIIGSGNKSCVGISGKIIDETRHLLIIETSKGIRKIPKKNNAFQITYLEDKINVDGALLCDAPAERIKSKVKNER